MPQGDLPLFYTFHFYLFGIIAMVSALLFVTRRSPVAAALWLVNTMFCLAALYVLLDAHFIGEIQVLVYAGAIMVVFLFVIMLLNLGQPSEIADARGRWPTLLAGAIGLLLLTQLLVMLRGRLPEQMLTLPAAPAGEAAAGLDVVREVAEAARGGAISGAQQRERAIEDHLLARAEGELELLAQARREKARGVGEADSALRQKPADDLRQAEPLGDQQRRIVVARPDPPAPAADRAAR